MGRSKQTPTLESKRTKSVDPDRVLYRNVYEAAPLAFVLWDRKCRITDWNRRAEMMFGWSREEVLGRNFFEFLIPDEARPHVEKIVSALLEGQVRRHTINENLTKRGDILLCEWNNTIRYDDRGRIAGAMSLGLDITERKRAETALLESEERLSLITNSLPVLIAYVDRNEVYRFANSEYTNWFGLLPSEIVGEKIEDVLGEAGYQEVRDKVKQVLSGQFVKYEGVLPMKQGGRRFFQARYIPHRGVNGEMSGFFVLSEDISERKKAELALKEAHAELERRVEERTAALLDSNKTLEREIEARTRTEAEFRQSENKYRALIHQASDAILMAGTDGRILDANQKAESLFGCTKEELLQKRFIDLHPREELERIVPAFEEILREGTGSLTDVGILNKDQTTVPVDITGSVVQFGEKKVVQGLFRDITERKHSEQVVKNIAEGVAASTGEAFFQSLVSQLARMLDMDYAFVGEFDGVKEERVNTIAVLAHDRIADNFVYDLAHTPCENVVGKVLCCYSHGVQEQFPLDEMLKDLRVDCYVGVPLFDSKGRPLGLIAVLDGQPLSNPQFVESTLRVFATRASAELERKHSEEALRRSENNLRILSSELLSAQEKERARIARELHDGIGQSLGTLKMRVETLNRLARSDSGQIDLDQLSSLVPLIQHTMEEVRNTSMALRPSTLDTLGILATITWFCREFEATLPGISVEKTIGVQESDIPEDLKTVLYRILQEAFNNVAKHSKASTVKLSLMRDHGGITLVVEDNGKGFDLPVVMETEMGLGLTSIRERTELSGGSFSMESEPDRGTTLRVSWSL
jgi:PAS domain S-box-containing protein